MPITAKVVNSKPAQARCTRYNFMRFSLSVTCDRPVVFSGYTPVSSNKTDLHAITDIVESGVNRHIRNPNSYCSNKTDVTSGAT